jgi:hypothetical protein
VTFPNAGAGEAPCRAYGIIGAMTASEWDWTLRVFDHVDLNASDYTASVRF